MRTSPIWLLEKKKFIRLVKKSNTISEILNHFGLQNKGHNHRTIKKRIQEEGLQFELNRINKHRKQVFINNLKLPSIIPIKDILIKNPPYSKKFLKDRIIKERILKNKCYICNQPPIWNNLSLVLQLDHINGDSLDYRLKNLRLLCPNCHTQTETFGSRKTKKQYNCSDCNKAITRHSKSGLCTSCSSKTRTKIKWPSDTKLITMIQKYGRSKTAKKLNISDVTVGKRYKRILGE